MDNGHGCIHILIWMWLHLQHCIFYSINIPICAQRDHFVGTPNSISILSKDMYVGSFDYFSQVGFGVPTQRNQLLCVLQACNLV